MSTNSYAPAVEGPVYSTYNKGDYVYFAFADEGYGFALVIQEDRCEQDSVIARAFRIVGDSLERVGGSHLNKCAIIRRLDINEIALAKLNGLSLNNSEVTGEDYSTWLREA